MMSGQTPKGQEQPAGPFPLPPGPWYGPSQALAKAKWMPVNETMTSMTLGLLACPLLWAQFWVEHLHMVVLNDIC